MPAKNNQEEEERRFLEISLNRSFPSQQRHIVVDTYENSAREEEGGEKREKEERGACIPEAASVSAATTALYREAGVHVSAAHYSRRWRGIIYAVYLR